MLVSSESKSNLKKIYNQDSPEGFLLISESKSKNISNLKKIYNQEYPEGFLLISSILIITASVGQLQKFNSLQSKGNVYPFTYHHFNNLLDELVNISEKSTKLGETDGSEAQNLFLLGAGITFIFMIIILIKFWQALFDGTSLKQNNYRGNINGGGSQMILERSKNLLSLHNPIELIKYIKKLLSDLSVENQENFNRCFFNLTKQLQPNEIKICEKLIEIIPNLNMDDKAEILIYINIRLFNQVSDINEKLKLKIGTALGVSEHKPLAGKRIERTSSKKNKKNKKNKKKGKKKTRVKKKKSTGN
tara:strand:- start:168 stop:1079 length:912 start_codon:yes stop_codon:yes gene_type:complete